MQLRTLLLSLVVPLVSSLKFTIPSTAVLANPNSLPASTVLTLTSSSHHYTAPLRLDSTFQLSNVSSGDYLVEVVCRDYHFDPLGVTIVDGKATAAWVTFRANMWNNKGPDVLQSDGSVQTRPVAVKEYYVERPKCTYLT
jgi:hypothetical protein